MRHLLSFIFISVPFLCTAQYGYVSYGYNGNVLTSERLDFVIDRYNETRPFLDETMDYPHYLDGFDIHLGGGNLILFDIGYTWRSSKRDAVGVDATATAQQRDLKYMYRVFDVGIGVNVINEGIKLGFGYNLTLGSEKVYTRIAPPGEVEDTDYEMIFKYSNPGSDIFLQVLFPFSESAGLLIKPYYHFSFKETDYAPLNEQLNPATYLLDDPVLSSKLSGFGISAMLAFGNF